MADNSTLSIDTSTPEGQLSISEDGDTRPVPRLPTDVLEDRSNKASFGLTDKTGIPKSDFDKYIHGDKETDIRQLAATKVDTVKQQMAKQWIDSMGANLTDEKLRDQLKSQDPNSVFEEHYASEWMKRLGWAKDLKRNAQDSWLYGAIVGLPQEYDYVTKNGSELMGKTDLLQTVHTNNSQNSTVSGTLDFMLKDIFSLGGYTETQLRTGGGNTGYITGGLGLGENLREQQHNIWQLPMDEFKDTVMRITSGMTPEMAAMWSASMLWNSDPERILYNLSTAGNLAIGAKAATTLGKNVISAAAREAAFTSTFQRTHDMFNSAAMYDRLIKSAADMIQVKPKQIPAEVAAPAVAGDLKESAINKVTIDTINELSPNNNPLNDLRDRLAAVYDINRDRVRANPGALGREMANRVSDMMDAHKDDFLTTVVDAFRINRTPAAVAIQENVQRIQEALADMHRGVDNQVLNVSQPIHIPMLNVYVHNIAVGTTDAELFRSLEEAKANARMNGWPIKGDYAVSPASRAKLVAKENLIKSFRIQATNATTPEGAAKATAIADKMQKGLDAVPRHTTGITIESQRVGSPFQSYESGIGPISPIRPTRTSTITPATTPSGTRTAAAPPIDESVAKRVDELARTPRTPDVYNESVGGDIEKALRRETTTDTERSRLVSKLEAEADAKSQAEFGRNATKDEKADYLLFSRELEDYDLDRARAPSKEATTTNRPWMRSISGRFMKQQGEMTDEQYELYKRWKSLTPAQRAKELEEGVVKPTPPKPSVSLADAEEPFYGLDSVIKQQGNGFYIQHVVYLPEGADFVRDGLLTHDIGELTNQMYTALMKEGGVHTAIPPSWGAGWSNAIMGQWRNPVERLSAAEMQNRLIATHGPSVLLGLIKRGLKPLEEIPKSHWNDFNRLIRYSQKAWNDETKTPGIWFDTPAEIEDWYSRYAKKGLFSRVARAPTEKEIRAYFAYKTLMVDDLHFRELSVMQRKLVAGIKQHSVKFTDASGANVSTPFFEGAQVSEIPHDARVLYVDSTNPSGSKVRWYGSLKNRVNIDQDIKEGRAKAIELADPKTRPLRDIDPRRVRYVITYSNEEKPLGYNHVNRLGGGHMVPEHGWFVKAADVDVEGATRIYNGDKTMLSARSKAEADEMISYLERVRSVLAKWKTTAAHNLPGEIERWENEGGALSGDNLLDQAAELGKQTGIPFQKLLQWWVGDGKHPAVFDVNEPLHSVPNGGRIIQMGPEGVALRARHPGLIDGTKDGSLLSKAMVEFTQERDSEGLFTLRKSGTESNPQFAYEPSELLDPITSMERGYGRIINSMYTWDMKQYTMEHWLEQAKDYLDTGADGIKEIRQNPLLWFNNPRFKTTIPDNIKAQLINNWEQARQFIGIPSKFDTGLQQVGQGLADIVYNQTVADRKFRVLPLDHLPKMTNVRSWLRQVAFVATQYSPVAWFTQASTLANVYFIAPKYAMSSTAAMSSYMWWKAFSQRPEILAGLDRQMGKFGWKPGQFMEAVKMMESSGFGHVGSEHAFREGDYTLGLQKMSEITPFTMGVKTIEKAGRTLLDWGAMPFNSGAATTRIAGFFTSYLEHAAMSPGGVINRQMQSSMLSRAALLDHNMSSAFTTKLQSGWLSIPMQFMTYDIRLAEMMYGKQLTRQEKMQLFAGSSMMYGLRGGGLLLFGLPVANMIANGAEEYLNWVPGHDTMKDLMFSGFPSWAFATLSGGGDAEKGTWLDFYKWGNKGVDEIEKFFDGSKTLAQVAGGAAGSVFESALKDSWGIRQIFHNMGSQKYYPITSDDVMDLAKEFRFARDTRRAYIELQTGKWLTQNESWITNVTSAQAWIQYITGLSPQKGSDIWRKVEVLKQNDEEIKFYQQKYAEEVHRALWLGSNQDKNNMDVHMRRANVILQVYIPKHLWSQTSKRAAEGVSQSLIDKVDYNYYIKYKNNWGDYRKAQSTETH